MDLTKHITTSGKLPTEIKIWTSSKGRNGKKAAELKKNKRGVGMNFQEESEMETGGKDDKWGK